MKDNLVERKKSYSGAERGRSDGSDAEGPAQYILNFDNLSHMLRDFCLIDSALQQDRTSRAVFINSNGCTKRVDLYSVHLNGDLHSFPGRVHHYHMFSRVYWGDGPRAENNVGED